MKLEARGNSPRSQAPEIILPTKAKGGFEDHICSFLVLGNKFLVWQGFSDRGPSKSGAARVAGAGTF